MGAFERGDDAFPEAQLAERIERLVVGREVVVNAALLLQIRMVAKAKRAGLQLRPVRAERMRRHAEHQHARALQPFLDPGRNAVAGLEHLFIEPHLHPVRPQPLRQRAHHRLVLRAVTEEDVV